MSGKLTLFLLGALIVLSACTTSDPRARTLYSGTHGILLSLPEQNGFQQYAGDTFSIAVRLENDGAFSINETSNAGYLNIIYDASVLDLTLSRAPRGNLPPAKDAPRNSPSVPFLLMGRSELVPVTGVDYADFTFAVRPLVSNRQMLESPVTIQACYPYQTIFVKNICVDRDLYTQKNTPICIARPVTDQGQGAPVAVTTVEPRFTRTETGTQPRFKITITNVDDGFVAYDPKQTSAELCSLDDFSKATWNKVGVTAHLGSVNLTCGITEPVARFDGRIATIVCSVPDNDPSLRGIFATGANYETPITVELHYFYISSITARVEVERP